MLLNEFGDHVAKGICQSVDSDLILGCIGPPSYDCIAVQISSSLVESEVGKDWALSLRA